MELVAIMRMLWRRRFLAALGLPLAIAVALLGGMGGSSHAGVATIRVVLDTPRSQLVHAAPSGADTLGWRAGFLGDLMASSPFKHRIAGYARVAERKLVVVNPSLAVPTVPTPLPTRASEAAAVTTEPYVLTVTCDEELPIILLKARAPERGEAARLVAAATRALKDSAQRQGSHELQAFMVESMSAVHSREIATGAGPLKPIAAALFVLVFWCAFAAALPAVGMARRRTEYASVS
jgi:hypothetical protein